MTEPPGGSDPGPDPVPSEGEELTPEEIRGFAERLEAWGQELTPKERMLLNVLILSVENPAPKESDFQQTVRPSIQELVERFLRSQLGPKQVVFDTDGGVWVKILPPTWTKSFPAGDEAT